MKLIVNGKALNFEKMVTLIDIMSNLNIVGKVMAIAVDKEVVRESNWEDYKLIDGDKVEMLEFVGGG